MIKLSTYLRLYKYVLRVLILQVALLIAGRVGDIVDVKANGAVQKG